ncbi:MAG: hypothetical protein IPM71_08380 [Bacteroidota bacterium]|nr:MAG: hypothetical protein IPM71_08380 [Bacteroidota bacterium]
MSRSKFLLIVLLFFGTKLFAQTPVDSILKVLNHSDDSSNFLLYTQLIANYTKANPDSALLFCQEAHDQA